MFLILLPRVFCPHGLDRWPEGSTGGCAGERLSPLIGVQISNRGGQDSPSGTFCVRVTSAVRVLTSAGETQYKNKKVETNKKPL